MYQIKNLDDNQLENITGGIDSLISKALGCLGCLSCLASCLITLRYRHDRNRRLTEDRNRQRFNDIIEDINIPVNNVTYRNRHTRTVD